MPSDLPQEIRDAYPEVLDAIHCAEFVLFLKVGGVSPWDIMEKDCLSPSARVAEFKRASLAFNAMTTTRQHKKILAQIDHPKFLAYVAGKMGAV